MILEKTFRSDEFYMPELQTELDKALQSIGSTARCVAIWEAHVTHPSALKGAKARIHGGGFLRFGLSSEDYRTSEEYLKAIDEMRRKTQRDFALKLQRVAHSSYDVVSKSILDWDERGKWLHSANVSVWDWMLQGDFQVLVQDTNRTEAPFVVASRPLQGMRAGSSHFLIALMSKTLCSVLDPKPYEMEEIKQDDSSTLCRLSLGLEEAIVLWIISEAHLAWATNVYPTRQFDFAREVARDLMEFHAARACGWGTNSVRQGGHGRRSMGTPSLFEWCSRVSHQIHEERPLVGSIGFPSEEKSFRQTTFSLKRPVRFDNERAVGKLIAASTRSSFPLLRGSEISEFGCCIDPNPCPHVVPTYTVTSIEESLAVMNGETLDDGDELRPEPTECDVCGDPRTCARRHLHREPVFGSTIKFLGRGRFRWMYRGHNVFEVDNGRPTLVRPILAEAEFVDAFRKCFPEHDPSPHWTMVEALVCADYGTTLVISSKALSEASRLSGSFAMAPFLPDIQQLVALAKVDGGLLVDPNGKLVAFGAILDGITAPARDNPSRGARYNSAVRYCATQKTKRRGKSAVLIVVVSQDGMVDVISSMSEMTRE